MAIQYYAIWARNGKKLIEVLGATGGDKTSQEIAQERVKELLADPDFKYRKLEVMPYDN